MPKSSLIRSKNPLHYGLLTSIFLSMAGGCSSLIQETRTEGTYEPEHPPLACSPSSGSKAPQVTKLGPYSEYGESTVSLEDACRIAEEKAERLAELYMSEYQNGDWTCKKTIERGSRERHVIMWQCLFNLDIICEHHRAGTCPEG